MNDAQVFSWILLSLSKDGSTRRGISQVADGINHAVPTHKEIESSLRWLQSMGFAEKLGKQIALTKSGVAFLSRFSSHDQPVLATWHLVADEIDQLLKAGK